MLNRNLNLQRFKVLFVTGNYSGILSLLHRRFTRLEIRKGFTTFQRMTILVEACHSFIIVEHAPLLYRISTEMVEYIQQALRQAAHEATVLLYSPGTCPTPTIEGCPPQGKLSPELRQLRLQRFALHFRRVQVEPTRSPVC